MGDIKRKYRPEAGEGQSQAKPQERSPQGSWEVKQRGNDFDVVRPRSERAPKDEKRSG